MPQDTTLFVEPNRRSDLLNHTIFKSQEFIAFQRDVAAALPDEQHALLHQCQDLVPHIVDVQAEVSGHLQPLYHFVTLRPTNDGKGVCIFISNAHQEPAIATMSYQLQSQMQLFAAIFFSQNRFPLAAAPLTFPVSWSMGATTGKLLEIPCQ